MGHIQANGTQYSPDLDRALKDIERLQAALVGLQAEAKFMREQNAALHQENEALRTQNKSLRLMVTIANEHLDRAQATLKDSEAVDAD
jgi:predicted  nucleic acid-binding Zn-ribbon protein